MWRNHISPIFFGRGFLIGRRNTWPMVIVSTFDHDHTTVLFVTTMAAISFARRFPWPMVIVNTFVHDRTNFPLIKMSTERIFKRNQVVTSVAAISFGRGCPWPLVIVNTVVHANQSPIWNWKSIEWICKHLTFLRFKSSLYYNFLRPCCSLRCWVAAMFNIVVRRSFQIKFHLHIRVTKEHLLWQLPTFVSPPPVLDSPESLHLLMDYEQCRQYYN